MAFFAIAGAVSTVVGTAMSIQGQRAAAQAQQQQAQYQIALETQTAQWNADQSRKQAKLEEETAMENMRRKRENNQRAIARQRATGARSGLKETGAVADVLTDTAERLQSDVDDIWRSASERSEQLRGQAQMSLWENSSRTNQIKYGAAASKQASKYSIYGTLAKGLGSAASAGMKVKGAWKTRKVAPKAPLKALPYNPNNIYGQ
jgi:hypothetical protein